MNLEPHPISGIFPLMEGDEFSALVEDIRANGVLEPITLYEDKILDGRNRYRAAEEAGKECPLADYDGDDPLGFVLSLNMHRRHLSDSQRTMVAAKLATLKQGGQSGQMAGSPSQEQAAGLLHVSERGIRRAKLVREQGVAELVRAVEQDRIPVAAAAEATQLSPEDQRLALASADPAKAVKQAIKRHRRELREIELAGKQMDMPTEKFAVLYVDCPWRFEPRSRETGMDRAADNHYPTEDVEKLCGMEVPAADDSACFFWATRAMLPQALRVLQAWGFIYKTCAVWRKPGMGTGYWFRDNAELLLLGVRGEVPAPAMGDQFLACFDAPKGKHSSKPEFVRHIIDSYFPHLSKLELFARGLAPPGWAFWGNQSEPASVARDAEAETGADNDSAIESQVGEHDEREANGGQHVGSEDGQQRYASPISRPDGRREGQDAEGQGHGVGLLGIRRLAGVEPGDVLGEDAHRGRRDESGSSSDGLKTKSKSALVDAGDAESSSAGGRDAAPQGKPAEANGNGEDEDPFASIKSIKRTARPEAPELPAILDRRAKRGVERQAD